MLFLSVCLKNYFGELNENNGKLHIFLHKLKPFSNYSIVIWCTLNYEDGKSTVYNFTTKEDGKRSSKVIVILTLLLNCIHILTTSGAFLKPLPHGDLENVLGPSALSWGTLLMYQFSNLYEVSIFFGEH